MPNRPHRLGGSCRGLTLIEVLISAVLLVIAASAAVAHVVRGAQHAEWTKDAVWAHQKAVSILNELRGYVEGGQAETAADLEPFDDGAVPIPTLTITRLPNDPDKYVAPDHPSSGNTRDEGGWRWYRQIQIRPFTTASVKDIRYCTVRIFRRRGSAPPPGALMAQVSTVISSASKSIPSTQSYDLYVIAIENCPSWWATPDAAQAFLDGALLDLQTKLPGVEFRVHWITRLGYGRDPEYAPYTNEERISTDPTNWAYVYPGRLPDGVEDERYYDPGRMEARINLDGVGEALFVHDWEKAETFTDLDGDGKWDSQEPFVDANGNGVCDTGNTVPYALADMHNHAMRYPDAKRLFDARVAAGLEDPETPTLRLLLDDMILDPDHYRNALIVNTHGDLLPMPPVRNYSDAAKIPETRSGWRVVTHPERLRPRRVAGDDADSDAPRFRVYAYKTSFENGEAVTTQAEPYVDANRNGVYDLGETFQDWNGNGVRDDELPITLVIPGVNLARAPNAASLPTLRIQCLAGGVDADGDGTQDPYRNWADAPVLPESFTDLDGDGLCEVAEPFLDLNGNKVRDPFEPYTELDGNGFFTPTSEPLTDANGNGRRDLAQPEEPYTDTNGNGHWDCAEPFWDMDGDGKWTPPTSPKTPYKAWNPAHYGNAVQTQKYLQEYGEPFLDLDGNGTWSAAEPYTDRNGNGRWDSGWSRGEMWCEVAYDGGNDRTVITLHGTPLETPVEKATGRGLDPNWRLYDLDYVPCPTPDTATGANRFARDLYDTSNVPKNTARWTVEIPLPALRTAFETKPGAYDGDAKDRLITVETRFGTDLESGTMWPARDEPQDVSRTYAWFYASVDDVPYSERYQFLGDPRDCPYADLDQVGTTSRNGYNWFFDEMKSVQNRWLAFDSRHLFARWMGRSADDVPRTLAWLRTAVVGSESLFSDLNGFTCRYLSYGGDVGYDRDRELKAIPMSGEPFGLDKIVQENTLVDEGSSEVKASRKLVRSNAGATNKGIRDGGVWWEKPWLGELFPDEAYATEWKPFGNLVASSGTAPLTYRLIRTQDVPAEQQPSGTKFTNVRDELAREGCVSLFMTGSKDRTFHHKDGGMDGILYGDGYELGRNYVYALPTQVRIAHPFKLAWDHDGDEPPEFFLTEDYPHFTAALGPGFYAKDPDPSKEQGSAVVRLTPPGGTRTGRFVVTSLDPATEGGASFTGRYGLLSLLHTFLAEGVPGTPARVRQLPLVKILTPTDAAGVRNPSEVTVRWRTTWARWDGKPYTESYPTPFEEDTSDLRYRILYSRDGGGTWQNALNDAPARPDVAPIVNGVLDTEGTLADANPAGDEYWVWKTPAARFPAGTYLVRVEAWWSGRLRQHAWHMERMYVDR